MRIIFKNKDGLKLIGILDRPKNKTKTCIILSHGFGVDKDEKGRFIELKNKLIKAGFAVFRFDYRAHGESGGDAMDLTFSGEKEDLEAAHKLLLNKGYTKFGIVGASFSGGSVSLFMANHQKDFRALVLWYPRINLITMYKVWLAGKEKENLKMHGFIERKKGFNVSRKLFDETLKIKPINELKKLKIPIMFVHGNKDTKVPYKESKQYAKVLNVELVTIKGGFHGWDNIGRSKGKANIEHLKQAVNATVEFFIKTLDKTFIFSGNLPELILRREKTTTWRLPYSYKDFFIGDTVKLRSRINGSNFGMAKILSIKYTTLGKLTKEDKEGHETFRSKREMYRTYSKYYNINATPKTRIEVFKFKLLKSTV